MVGDSQRKGEARKSKVGDKIKKRMSMRFVRLYIPSSMGGGPIVSHPDLCPTFWPQANASLIHHWSHALTDFRYAGGDQVSAAPPPLPGQPSAFLASDPYQTILPDIVRSSSIVEDEEPIDEEVGESRFGMFGNTAFSQNGFGGGQTSIQEERIRRRGAADLTIDEWDLEELHRDAMDINAFLRKTLTGADEEELTRFKAALMRQKQSNAKELQRSVFKQ